MTLRTSTRLAVLGLAATLTLGCDTKETPTAVPAASPAATGTPATAAPMDPTMPPSVTASQSPENATAAAGDSMSTQAQKLYDDARAAINKADFSGAQKHIDQLTALKSKLSPEWQTKVTELEKMFADGKAKMGGMTMPKLGQ